MTKQEVVVTQTSPVYGVRIHISSNENWQGGLPECHSNLLKTVRGISISYRQLSPPSFVEKRPGCAEVMCQGWNPKVGSRV